MMARYPVLALSVVAACFSLLPDHCRAEERARIGLDGEWEFRLDPARAGESAEWHSAPVPFPRAIQVPGAWQAHGVGERSGILRNHYAGSAWYRRRVAIPSTWSGSRVTLRIGGVLRRATVFVNGRKAGEHDGFSTPFAVDISDLVRPGAENVLAVIVENTAAEIVGSPDIQKGSEPTGMLNYIGNWGGIYGSVQLEASAPAWIDEVAVSPDLVAGAARFRVSLRSREPGGSRPVRVEVSVDGHTGTADATLNSARATAAEVKVDMPGATPWSPERPALYRAAVRLLENGRERDRVEERFGMREITIRGSVLLLNGKPLYLRGYGDDNVEVLTGTPPASKQTYLERLRLARSFGFNAVRFHSMTPTREFFEAADETGILVMAELPAAYTMYVLPHREFLRRELERVLRTHRNHPSFLSLAFGNEFNLNWLKTPAEKAAFRETVEDYYRFAKSIDPSRVIMSNDGLLLRPTDMVSLGRGAPGDVPAVRHEFGGYYCSLPDPSLIGRFTGVMAPTWLEEKRKWAEDRGLAGVYASYVRNSQRLQHIGRKYQIERARRMGEFTGYGYWLIVDYPGGTGEGDSWEEGWLDYFWQPKNVTPEQGRELNSPVLLMIGAGQGERTMWTTSSRRIEVLVSNYGNEAIEDGVLAWELRSGETRLSGSEVRGIRAPLGSVGPIATISVGPVGGDEARKLELVVTLKAGSAAYTNRWSLWAFPRENLLRGSELPVASTVKWDGIRRLYPFITETPSANGLLITSSLDSVSRQHLAAGGRVWLLADRTQFERSGDANFFPASGGAQGTMIPSHAALAGFPQEGYCDLQFFNLFEGGWNFPLDAWPKELVPIIGGIRTTSSFLSKQKNLSRTGYVFEVASGEGGLLVSTLNLRQHLDEAYPEALYLFDRLLRYAAGPDFRPAVAAGDELLRRLEPR